MLPLRSFRISNPYFTSKIYRLLFYKSDVLWNQGDIRIRFSTLSSIFIACTEFLSKYAHWWNFSDTAKLNYSWYFHPNMVTAGGNIVRNGLIPPILGSV